MTLTTRPTAHGAACTVPSTGHGQGCTVRPTLAPPANPAPGSLVLKADWYDAITTPALVGEYARLKVQAATAPLDTEHRAHLDQVVRVLTDRFVL